MVQRNTFGMLLLLLGSTVLQSESATADRLAGALMGAALGDARARVTSILDNQSSIDAKYGSLGPSSFEDFQEQDFVTDKTGSKRVLLGWPTILSMLSLRLFTQARYSYLTDECPAEDMALGLLSVYEAPSQDPYFSKRYHPAPNLLKAIYLKKRQLMNKTATWWSLGSEEKMKDSDLQSESDSGALAFIWPIALAYSDQQSRACWYADTVTMMTHRHPTARAASAALVTGVAQLLEGSSLDDTIDEMVRSAEKFDRLERRIKKKARKMWARRHFSKECISRDEMLTSDMIRYAAYAAQSGHSADEVLGYVSKRQDNNRSFRGFLLGYQADEAVAAAVYLLVKHQRNYQEAFIEGARAGGNGVLIASLAGALIGAYTGYDELIEQGLSGEIAVLEKGNELYSLMEDVVRARVEEPVVIRGAGEDVRSLTSFALAGISYEEAKYTNLPKDGHYYNDLIKKKVLSSETALKKRVKNSTPVSYLPKKKRSFWTPTKVMLLGSCALSGYLLYSYAF